MKYGKLKRTAGILLSAVLLLGSLAGCSGKENVEPGASPQGTGNSTEGEGGEQAMGRFLEDDVKLPIVFSDIFDMRKLEDGTIRVIGNNGDDGSKTVWDSKDSGVNWEKAFDIPAELEDGENGYVDGAALSPNGQSVWLYNKVADGGVQCVLYLLDQNGGLAEVPFELPAAEGKSITSSSQSVNISEDSGDGEDSGVAFGQEANSGDQGAEDGSESGDGAEGDASISSIRNLVTDLMFLGNDQILVVDMTDKVFQISTEDGSTKRTYEFGATQEACQFYTAGKKMVVATSTEALVYDTETGEQMPTEEALQGSVADSGLFNAVDSADGGESIYYLTGKGLFHYKFGGSVMEQLIDGSMNSLGAPAFYPIALAMLDEQSLLVAANDANAEAAGGVSLLKYTWSADTPAKPDKELKVYSLYNNRELRQAISNFQKDHTDIYVNYQTAMSEDNGMTVSDALKTLTTEIMAGKGPDLLVLDGMPIQNYMEKGILKDISAVLADGEGTYFENIIKAYQGDGGQAYAVPARFLIPMAQGSSANYTPGEDFDAFTSKQGVLSGMVPETTVEKFWYSCGAAWQKEDGTLDAGKITDWLAKLKNAYGEYDRLQEENSTTYVISDGGGAFTQLQELSLSLGDFDLAFGRYRVNVGLSGQIDYGQLSAVNEKLEQGDYGLMPGQAGNVFVPSMVLGISSKAAQPETAEEFVKYLLSPEAQKAAQFGGLPVERDSFLSVIDGHEYEGKENWVSGGSAGANADERLSYRMEPTPKEEIEKMTAMAESLTVPALLDDVIKDAVIEQGTKVLKGEAAPEEAADAIMQKVNIYLAE